MFAPSYFAPTYFDPRYFSDSHPSNVITPYSDIVNFSLFLNKNTYFNLEIQTQLEQILSINRQVENSVTINR